MIRPPRSTVPPRGFTLVEAVISMTLLLMVVGTALKLFSNQMKMLAAETNRSDAQQSAQFALTSLDRELRMAGAGVTTTQPVLVQADSMAITFNSNLVSLDPNDYEAVYYDPDANPTQVGGLTFPQDQDSLPYHDRLAYGKTYPEVTYRDAAGAQSRAETITYWFAKQANGDYTLFRRVNRATPLVIATGVKVDSGYTFLQYFRTNDLGALVPVDPVSLPLRHVKLHGGMDDVDPKNTIDRVQTVRLRLTTQYRDPRGGVSRRIVESWIPLRNQGLLDRVVCGEAPLTVTPTAQLKQDTDLNYYVEVTWPMSLDETGGEKDVEKYLIFRKEAGAVEWGEPRQNQPGTGIAPQPWHDTDVESGKTYVYGAAAQDCSPTNSPITATGSITIPIPVVP